MNNSNWNFKPTNQNHYYKIVVIGDKNVGKTSFISNFNDESKDIILSGVKRNNNSIKRIKIIKVNKQIIRLQVSKYEEKSLGGGIDKSYFQNTSCFYLMFDVTDEDSLQSCKLWLKDIIKYSKSNTPIILIGNKIDLKNERKVEQNQIKEFIYNTSDLFKINQDIPYFEISSIDSNEKIYKKLFKKSYKLINERIINYKTSPSSSPPKNNNNSADSNSNHNSFNNISSIRISNEDESMLSKRGSILISKLTNLLKKE